MEQASSLVHQKRLTEAAALYQKIIDEYGQKLTKAGDTIYISATVAAHQQIMLDAGMLDAYQQLYSAQAQRVIDQLHANDVVTHAQATLELGRVMDRFFLTQAGLDAALELASRELESARPADAHSILRRVEHHPNMESRKAQWHGLLAAAAVFEGLDEQAGQQRLALAALQEQQGEQSEQATLWITQMDRWLKLRVVPQAPQVMDAVRPQSVVKLPEVYKSPLWRVKVSDDPSEEQQQGNNGRLANNLRSSRGQTKPPENILRPMERQGVMYLNEAEQVMALDVHSGRVLWRVETKEFNELTSRNLPFRMYQADLRGVAISGDLVAAVVGRQSSMPGRMGNMVKPTRLLGLDANDGSVRYTIDPMELPDPLEELNFHGTPILAGGRLYVLGRRSRMTGFHTEYLFAFDAMTGQPLWRRHLASANAPANRRAIHPMGQMLLDRGRLYIADNLGAVSCVDALQGTILWLAHGNTMPNALEAAMGRVATPSLLMGCSPIMVDEGLLVAPANAGQTAVLLDRNTGLETRKLDAGQWSQNEYLVKVDNDVYSIGHRVQRFDGRTLLRKWGVGLSGGKVDMQGLAAFTKDHLLLPVNNRLVVLDRDKGTMVMQPELTLTGSLLALESQVVVTGPSEAGGFMSWEDAYARLSAQIAAKPTDPAPAMALAHLAGESNQPAAMLKAVDQAIMAVNRLPLTHTQNTEPEATQELSPRRQVFEQIIDLARNAGSKNAGSRRGLYDRLAIATSDLGDEVTYHLIFGDFLIEAKEYQKAADQYQFILNDESLSQQLYTRDNLARQGGLEARVRLTKLIEKYGLETYRTHEMVAASRLVELTSPNTKTDPQLLIDLARQYPVSRSAAPALIAASDRLVATGRTAEAARQLRAAYELSNEAGVLQRVIGKMVTLYLAQGQPRQARTWLMLAGRRGIDPLREGKPIRAQAWLEEMQGLSNAQLRLASMSLPLAQPRVIEAGLLTPRQQPQSDWPVNLMMTRTADRVQLRRGPSWEAIWESPVKEGEVELLWLTQDRALLWQAGTHELISLDVASGQQVWDTIDVMATLKRLGGVEQKWNARSSSRRQFEGWMDAGGVVFRNGRLEAAGSKPREGVLIAVNELVICVVDGIGRATGIDRHTGRPLWSRILPIDQVNLLKMDDQTLAAGGLNGVRVGAEGGALILIDPMTGEPYLESPIEDKRPLNWLGLGGMGGQGGQSEGGMVFFSTGQELVAHRVHDGQLVWRLPVQDKNFTGTGSMVDGSLLMQDTEGSMWVIDTQTGKVRSRVSFPMVQSIATWIQPARDVWHIATQSQAAALTDQGKVLWRDGLGQLPGQVIVAQWVSRPYVGLLTVNGVNPFENAQAGGGNGMVQPMPGVRIQIRNQQVIQRQLVEQAARKAAGVPALDKPQAPIAADGNYELLLMDRQTGKAVLRQTLHFDGRAMHLRQALTLDQTLVIGDASVTILIPAQMNSSP